MFARILFINTKETHMSRAPEVAAIHSSGWVAQTWISFAVSTGVTAMGIWCLPTDVWIKGFMAMGMLFCVGSTFSLSKTVRDLHESDSLRKRIDDARVSRLIAEHDPLKPSI
jgi:hypothetical protein